MLIIYNIISIKDTYTYNLSFVSFPYPVFVGKHWIDLHHTVYKNSPIYVVISSGHDASVRHTHRQTLTDRQTHSQTDRQSSPRWPSLPMFSSQLGRPTPGRQAGLRPVLCVRGYGAAAMKASDALEENDGVTHSRHEASHLGNTKWWVIGFPVCWNYSGSRKTKDRRVGPSDPRPIISG